MKRIAIFLLSVLLISCSQEAPQPDETWVRSVGGRMANVILDVESLSDGRVVVVGQQGYPAYDYSATVGVNYEGNIQERGCMIALLSPQGRLIKKRLFRAEDIRIDGLMTLNSIGDRGTFTQVIPTPDGGFLCLGEWRGAGFSGDPNGQWGFLQFEPGDPSAYANFVCKFDSDLKLTNFRTVMGSPLTPNIVFTNAHICISPSGEIKLATSGLRTVANITHMYALFTLDQDGNAVDVRTTYTNPPWLSLTRDLMYSTDGELLMFGQEGNKMVIHNWGPEGFGITEVIDVADDGVGPGQVNGNNAFLVNNPQGGYIAVHMDAPQSIVLTHLDEDLNLIKEDIRPEVLSEGEYPLDASMTEDGELLLQTNLLYGAPFVYSRLYKLTADGQLIWQREFSGVNGSFAQTSDGFLLIPENYTQDESIQKARLIKAYSNGLLE
ncbi:hypothetical protein HZ996_00600 [Cryomorphaceae bacterium]|nr:hypothetical protein HZ996_00600 [Cryomorphaceae bacterium]